MKMKSNVFVRPNLKAFVLGALVLAVVQHFMADGLSQTQRLFRPLAVNAREMDDKDLRELIRIAAENPSTEAYMHLSHYFEKRGNYKQALHFLRSAEQVESSEDLN
jgi:hypothetical protein